MVFNSASYLKVNLHINKVKFYQSFNNIFAKLGASKSFDTMVQLMKTNCLSVLLYSLESVYLTKDNINNLEFPLKRAFIKMFHVKESMAISWCQYYMCQLPVVYILDIRKRKYLNRLGESDCSLLKHLYNNCAEVVLNKINDKYNVSKNTSDAKFRRILWSSFYNSLCQS